MRGKPKGRAVDSRAVSEVQALLGSAPRRRDLLIEHLHKIQDRHGHISAAHVVALAREMGLATTEVYEVATFYHHFDVVKEDGKAPPALTVRVCDSLSCELSGANALIAELKQALGEGVRVIPAPCVGRCEQAPVAVV
ncbi:MAG TPA: NAD(P)H-dependent oxidoreductase subunit E, partial [Burkholderiales bacterium]|nr:NAD(P)H-dependent oxidoreductase subunit E [Burkholderiales bacterium]